MAETSLAKMEANRKNARKSTGPKDTSMTRLNAVQHGLLSKELVLKGEDKKALRELGKRLRMDLAPQGELEMILVDRIISSVWRLRRAIQVERDFIQHKYDDTKYDKYDDLVRPDDEVWSLVVSGELGNSNAWLNLIRYETTVERQVYKALHELQRLQSTRKGEKPAAPVAIDVDVTKDT